MILELEQEFEKAQGVDAELIDRQIRIDGCRVPAKLFCRKLFDRVESSHLDHHITVTSWYTNVTRGAG